MIGDDGNREWCEHCKSTMALANVLELVIRLQQDVDELQRRLAALEAGPKPADPARRQGC